MDPKKNYLMVKEATKSVESINENASDPVDVQDIEAVDDFLQAVFINELPSKRVRTLCQKYYGDEWDNS